MESVELLPATGYRPIYGEFTVSPDKTKAVLDFNTNLLPDGVYQMSISAFIGPPGTQFQRQIIAMPARAWEIRNGAPPVFTVTLGDAPADGTLLSGDSAFFSVKGNNIGNAELVSANDPTIIYGRFSVSSDKTFATLAWNFHLPQNYGTFDVRILAWDVPPGQSGRQIEVMPKRHYIVNVPLGCSGRFPECGGPAP
jgi:hypothetical protein